MMKLKVKLLCSIIGTIITILTFYISINSRKTIPEYLKFNQVLEELISQESPQVSPPILAELFPRPHSIFFVETSGQPSLSYRQSCAVESAAKHHNNTQVYVLLTSPVVDVTAIPMHTLYMYKNVHIKYLHIGSLLEGSPLESLWNSSVIQSSQYLTSHMSDVVRFVVLYRFGGTYLDLDVVMLKPLPSHSQVPNLAGRESWTFPFVAAGVLRFEPAHPVLYAMLLELSANFDGSDWGANGPGVVTKVLKRECGTDDLDDMTPAKCLGVRVFPPEAFYPIPWRQWRSYFDPAQTPKVMDELRDSYAAHLWGKHSQQMPLEKQSSSSYSLLAHQHCPHTMAWIQ